MGRGGVAALPRPRHRRSGSRRHPPQARSRRSRPGVRDDPSARDDERQGDGPAQAGVRRAVPGAARAGDAQARARAHVARLVARRRRRAGSSLPRRPPVPVDRGPVASDRRDRGRPRRPQPDAPVAAGRCRCRQDGRRRVDPAARRAGRSSGGVDGAHRGARRATRRRGECAAGRPARARHRQPVRRPPGARRAAHQSRDRIRSHATCSADWRTDRSTSRSARMR